MQVQGSMRVIETQVRANGFMDAMRIGSVTTVELAKRYCQKRRLPFVGFSRVEIEKLA